MLFGILGRIGLRLNSAIPPRFPGPAGLQMLETASHKVFYLLLLLLPLSGVTYGYFSGTGVPGMTKGIKDPSVTDMEKANKSIDVHRKLGMFLEYLLVPFHV